MLTMAPYHKNERNRLNLKIEQACHNLSINTKEDKNTINVIFIHLPRTASLDTCEKWVKDYFINYPEKPVSGVLFLKPVVILDFEKKISNILYSKRLIINEKFEKWYLTGSNRDIQLEVPVAGQITDDDSEIVFRNYYLEKQDIKGLYPNECYVYNKGELFTNESNSDNKVGLISPGVYKHLVLMKNGEYIVKKFNGPNEDELILI